MTDLSTIFGDPRKGIHTHFCRVAIADVAMTGVAAVLIACATNKSVPVVFAALIYWKLVYVVFGVPTALNKQLGLTPTKQPLQHLVAL
jgi:hypothetical protein